MLTEEISKTPTFPPHVSQVIPMSGPIRGSTTVTMCGRNFGFDKTESFKTSLVSVEVAGAPCKLPRQDYGNKCVLVFVRFSGCGGRPYVFRMRIHPSVAQGPEYISYVITSNHTTMMLHPKDCSTRVYVNTFFASYTCSMMLTKIRASTSTSTKVYLH